MRRRAEAAVPPRELTSWSLFAALHDESKLDEWIELRQRWEAEHGPFPDGESTVASQEPPDELRDFELRCARRGVRFHLVWPDDPPEVFAERTALYEEWLAERECFAAEYGWHGGRAVRREETSYGLFDPNEL